MEADSIDYSLVLADGAPQMLLAGGVLALSVFLVMFIIIKKRWNARVLPFFIGIFMFSLVKIFVMLVTSALSLIPSVDLTFEYNPNALTVLDCLLATFGYMAARWGNAKIMSGRFDGQGDVYMSGLGMGFGDAFLYGLSTVSNYVWCIAIDNGTLEQAFEGLSDSDALDMFQSLSDLFYAPSALWLFIGASTVIDLALHVLLSSTIYGVVKGSVPSMWHALCAVIYAAVVIPFQFYDSTSLNSIIICFAVKFVIFAAAAYYLVKKVLGNIKYEKIKQ